MSTKKGDDHNDSGGDWGGGDGVNIPPKPPRPYTAYHIFFQLERNFILQNDVKGKHLELPAEIDENASERPERYRGVVMRKNWFVSGRVRKRKDHKIHGVISFTDLTKTVSRNWKAADPEVRIYCHAFADKLFQRYQAEMAAYKEKYGSVAIVAQSKKRKQESKKNTKRLEVLSRANKHPLHWTMASSQPDAGASGSAVAALPVFANAWMASHSGTSGAQGSVAASHPFLSAAWASTCRTSQEATAHGNERSTASNADPPIIHYDTNPNTLNNSKTPQHRLNPTSSRSQPPMNNLGDLPTNQNSAILNFDSLFRQESSNSPKTNNHNHHSNATTNSKNQHSHPNPILNLHNAYLNSNLSSDLLPSGMTGNASGRTESSIHNYVTNSNAASYLQNLHPPLAPPQFLTTSMNQNQYNPSNDNRQNLNVHQGPTNRNQGQHDAVILSFGLKSNASAAETNSAGYTNHTNNLNQNQNPSPVFRNANSNHNLPHEVQAQHQSFQMPSNARHYPIAHSASTNGNGCRMQASGSLQSSRQPAADQMQMPFDSSANAYDGYSYVQGQGIGNDNGNEHVNSDSLPVQLPAFQQGASGQVQVSLHPSSNAQATSSAQGQGIGNDQGNPGNLPAQSSFDNAQGNSSNHPLKPRYYLDVQPDPISDAALKRAVASGNALNEEQHGFTLDRDVQRFLSEIFQGHELDNSLSGLSEQALPPGQQRRDAVQNQQQQSQQQLPRHHPSDTLEVRMQHKSSTNTTTTSSLDSSSGGNNSETGG